MADVSSQCDIGNVRTNNEDTLFVDEVLGLYVVCDGIGGHKAGEVASAIGCESMQHEVEAGKKLIEACQIAHENVRQRAQEDEECQGMGSTLIAARLVKSKYEIVWVGDSRAYLINTKKNSIIQLSQDHSFIAEKIAAGILNEEEAKGHPMEHILTQSLGCRRPILRPGQIEGKLKKEELLLLCSDGLYNECSDDDILNVLKENDFHQSSDALVRCAKDNGGRDNISVILIRRDQKSLQQSLLSTIKLK